MRRYFWLRLAAAVPTLLGISLVVFAFVQCVPGGPVEQTLAEWRFAGGTGGDGGNGFAIPAAQREALVRHYGFDRPLPERYLRWLGGVMRFDFGESYYYGEPVVALLRRALPVSLTFGLASFFLSYLLCIPLGVAKAVRHGSRFDTATSLLLFFLYSVPPFALAIVLIVLFGGGSFWNVFPIQGMVSDDWAARTFFGKIFDFMHHMFLPVLCFVVGHFAPLTFLVKNSLAEQLRQDYVLAVRAKGGSASRALWAHAFRNALLPLVATLGQWLGAFLTGSLLLETIFGLQGLGRLSFDSALRRDYPVVLATVLLLSLVQVLGNLLADLLTALLDPRIDFRSEGARA